MAVSYNAVLYHRIAKQIGQRSYILAGQNAVLVCGKHGQGSTEYNLQEKERENTDESAIL